MAMEEIMEWLVSSLIVFIGGVICGAGLMLNDHKNKLKKGMMPFIASDETLQWSDKA